MLVGYAMVEEMVLFHSCSQAFFGQLLFPLDGPEFVSVCLPSWYHHCEQIKSVRSHEKSRLGTGTIDEKPYTISSIGEIISFDQP